MGAELQHLEVLQVREFNVLLAVRRDILYG
jgi:hypothetical protein